MTRLVIAAALALSVLSPAAARAAPAGLGPGFQLEPVASGYSRPLYVASHNGSGRIYVVEQRGVIHTLKRTSSGGWQKDGVFLDLRSRVAGPLVGRGLLGMAFHPSFAKNGRFYVFHTRKSSNASKNGDIVIAEYRKRTNARANPSSRRQVLVIDHPSAHHFGGWMGFGADGYMYVTTGDAASVALGFPQNLNSRLGKILRFNPLKQSTDPAFVPPDNPFVGVAGDDLVWAYGLRNPWRASFDATTGALWLSDVGQNSWEEINRLAPGGAWSGSNMGWSMCEGTHEYPPPSGGPAPCTASGTVAPIVEYAIDGDNCSVIGGYVYRGTANPSLVGRYFFGDYCSGRIWSVAADHQLGDPLGEPLHSGGLITSFGVDALGEIYVTFQSGTVRRIQED